MTTASSAKGASVCPPRRWKTVLLAALVLAQADLLLAVPPRTARASLEVTTFPSGVEVFVDGVSTHRFTPVSIDLTPGSHAIGVSAGSAWTVEGTTTTLLPGPNRLHFTLKPVVLIPAPYAGKVTFTNALNQFTGDGTGLAGVAAVSATRLTNAAFGNTMSIGCTLSSGAVSCPSECFDSNGVNTCQILADPVYPSSGWMRLAFLNAPLDNLIIAQVGSNAIYCTAPHASLAIPIEVRMQAVDFETAPPPNWPSDATNVAFGSSSVVATVTPGVTGPQFLSRPTFTSSVLPRGVGGTASYAVFAKALLPPDYVASDGCYLMRTPVSVATLPWAGQQVDVTPR